MFDSLNGVQFHEMNLEGLKKIVHDYWKDFEKPVTNFMFIDDDYVI